MSTVSAPRPPSKPARTVRLPVAPSADLPSFIFTILEGHKSDDYYVRPVPADFGTGYVVEKIFDPDGHSYAVNLHDRGGSCECKGHLRWGHCRHVEALTALHQA